VVSLYIGQWVTTVFFISHFGLITSSSFPFALMSLIILLSENGMLECYVHLNINWPVLEPEGSMPQSLPVFKSNPHYQKYFPKIHVSVFQFQIIIIIIIHWQIHQSGSSYDIAFSILLCPPVSAYLVCVSTLSLFLSYIFTHYQVKEDEIHRMCSMLGRGETCVQNFGQKMWREETTQKT